MINQKELKRAWAEIHLDCLKRNVEKCRGLISKPCEMMCVVKANCYGHGIEKIIPCLQDEAGIDWFAVCESYRGDTAAQLGVTGEVLILGYTPPQNAPELVEYDIIQAVTEYSYACELSKSCPIKEKIRVHIAVDTGMTRIGVRAKDVGGICDEIQKIVKLPSIETEGIFTHLSVADSAAQDDIEFTKRQIELICEVKRELNRRLVVVKRLHFLNSAGAAYHFDSRSDLARFGIMLYGLHPNSALPLPVELEPVMELKAAVSQVKTVEAGVSVSYGRTYVTDRETRIATVTIGYADGYPRLLSGRASVIIRGRKAPIIGRVCMDQLMIDVSGIPDVAEGDVVTLFGTDGDESITADELADIYGSIGYEIVCGISPRVPRIFIE